MRLILTFTTWNTGHNYINWLQTETCDFMKSGTGLTGQYFVNNLTGFEIKIKLLKRPDNK